MPGTATSTSTTSSSTSTTTFIDHVDDDPAPAATERPVQCSPHSVSDRRVLLSIRRIGIDRYNLSFSWNFGDGTATGPIVAHTFTAPNPNDPVNTQYLFKVTLTVTDSFNRMSSSAQSITVFKRY